MGLRALQPRVGLAFQGRFVSCRPAGSFFRLNGTSKPFGDFQVMASGTGRGTSRNASRGAPAMKGDHDR